MFEIVPDADKKASIDLFRYRKFRYWKSKKDNDFVICKLYDSNGKLLKSVKLDANLPHEYKRVAVSSPDGKNIRAEVVFQNDCWGGVSSSNRMRLFSNRRFGARSRISVPFAFYIKVPMSGKLKIEKILCINRKLRIVCKQNPAIFRFYTLGSFGCIRHFFPSALCS